jgi:hypothetical protein
VGGNIVGRIIENLLHGGGGLEKRRDDIFRPIARKERLPE